MLLYIRPWNQVTVYSFLNEAQVLTICEYQSNSNKKRVKQQTKSQNPRTSPSPNSWICSWMPMALLEIPMSGWTCFSTLKMSLSPAVAAPPSVDSYASPLAASSPSGTALCRQLLPRLRLLLRRGILRHDGLLLLRPPTSRRVFLGLGRQVVVLEFSLSLCERWQFGINFDFWCFLFFLTTKMTSFW